jgi:hypothetical protein
MIDVTKVILGPDVEFATIDHEDFKNVDIGFEMIKTDVKMSKCK